jgi:hypothetical protein
MGSHQQRLSIPVLMMRPHFFSSMWGKAAFVVWKALDRHTLMMSSLQQSIGCEESRAF